MTLPAAVRNPVSLLGMAIATATAVLFLVFLALELFGYLQNPYVGLLTFVAIPAAFLAGLLLIPVGAWWARRRRGGEAVAEWPVIDLRVPRQRMLFTAVVVLTLVNIAIVSVAAFGGVHYMERREFCGQVCHTTMEPEFVAQQVWPHAEVQCVGCHVGPGVGPLIESKLAGTRQLYHLVTDRVPKPIPTPAHTLGDTRQTCEGCHWRDAFHGDRPRVIREFANDERNAESTTTLRMHVGSAAGPGIHRHLSMDVEYVAADEKRDVIPYVRQRDADGTVREYVMEGASRDQVAAGVRRRMDCTDCHNRPAHTMFYTATRAVDAALAQGRIPRDLPFVRRQAVEAVSVDYADRETALDGIATRLRTFYASSGGADTRLVERAVTGAQQVWRTNVFPAMHVKWGTYPNHLGHVDTPGCFRCHDDSHRAADGAVIRQDCELCHAIE